MSEVKKTTLSDRLRAAVRAFLGKPKDYIDVGVRIKRCSECEHIDPREIILPKKVDKEVCTFHACIDRCFATETRVDREDMDNMFKNECALELLRELKAAGAITFTSSERREPCPGLTKVHYETCIDVVMPEKEAES